MYSYLTGTYCYYLSILFLPLERWTSGSSLLWGKRTVTVGFEERKATSHIMHVAAAPFRNKLKWCRVLLYYVCLSSSSLTILWPTWDPSRVCLLTATPKKQPLTQPSDSCSAFISLAEASHISPSALSPLSYCLKLVSLGSVKHLKSKCSLYPWIKSLHILFLCFSSCLKGNVFVQSMSCGFN